jgi:hypothetical protein
VWRQLRNWKTALAFFWGLFVGICVLVLLVCGTVAMSMRYLA